MKTVKSCHFYTKKQCINPCLILIQYQQCHILAFLSNIIGSRFIQYKHWHFLTLLILSIVEWLWCLIQYKQCHILAIFPNKNGSKSIQYKHCHLLAGLILDFLEWYNSSFSKNNAIWWQFYRIWLALSLFSINIDISKHFYTKHCCVDLKSYSV